MKILRMWALVVLSVSVCSAFDTEEAVVAALRWYHRWIAELPPTVTSMDCTLGAFPGSGFAYCEPGSLGVDLEMPKGSPAVATNISRILSGFAEALSDFVKHRNSGPRQNPTFRTWSIPVRDLLSCRIDLEQTRRLVDNSVGSRQRRELLNRGISLRFPLACQGDPFYLVYFMKGDEVEWIWQIQPGSGPVWHYERNVQQRRIPDLAIKNVARPELWYDSR